MSSTKWLSCGEYNIYFKYILLATLYKIINDCLYGFFIYEDLFVTVKIFPDGAQKYLSKHYLIHSIFNYLGTFLFSYLYYKYETYVSRRDLKNSKITIKKQNSSSQIVLIHNDSNGNIEDKVLYSKTIFFQFITITILWVVEEKLLVIYLFAFKDLDFWMLELLIITYFSAKMFKLQVYNHQIVAILFNVFPCILKILTIFLSFYDQNNNPYTQSNSLIAFGIIMYLILITLRSYVNSKIKWLMDLKYISTSRFLMIYGLIGAGISLIACIVTTFIKCKECGVFNEKREITDDICKVKYNNTNENYDIYFDNFKIYFSNIRNVNDFFKEFFIIIVGMITYYFSEYNCLLVIKYLTPVYIIFSNPICFFFQKVLLILNTLYEKHSFFYIIDKIKLEKFSLDISGDVLSFLGFLVYLEIIELNFCNLNFNLRKSIMKRANFESYECESERNDSTIINSEDEEETVDNINEKDTTSNLDITINF